MKKPRKQDKLPLEKKVTDLWVGFGHVCDNFAKAAGCKHPHVISHLNQIHGYNGP